MTLVGKDRTENEKRITRCYYCGKEINYGRIFCPEHATPLNKQIFEFFSEFPVDKSGVLIRPRGAKMYELIKYYLAAKLGLSDKKRIILKSVTGSGKCITGESLILTKEGFKQIKNVNIGDTVLSFSSQLDTKWKKVISKYKFENQNTIKIITSRGFELEGTYDHKILILNEDGELEFRELSSLTNKDHVLLYREPIEKGSKGIINFVHNTSYSYEFLSSLLNHKLYIDRVAEKIYNKNDVYDVTVEDYHTYFANGFYSHNSVLLDMLAYIELTHFPHSLVVIGSISEPVSKMHIERLREWIGASIFNRYIEGTHESTASKTEIKLAKLNSKVISMPQSPKTRTGWHASLLLIDEVGRMQPESYYASFLQMAAQGGIECLACFDEQTEVLCIDGFKNIKQVSTDDYIATYNLKTQNLEYQHPKRIFVYDYKGEMIELVSREVDLLVTPEHKLYVLSPKSSKERDYRPVEAQQLLQYEKFSEHYIPLAPIPQEGKEIDEFYLPKLTTRYGRKGHHTCSIPMDLWLEFLGYYLSEGWTEENNRVVIAQKKFSRKKMQQCCETLAAFLNQGKCEISKQYFCIASRQLCEELRGEKRIPPYVFQCSLRQRKIFLEAFNLGAIAHYQEWGGFMLSLNAHTEKKLADDFQRLFLSIGMSTTQEIKEEQGRILIFGNNRTHGNISNKSLKRKEYKGKVFGFQLPNQTLFVRRAGKVCVSGNSTPYLDSIVMQNIWNADNVIKIALEPEECWWIPSKVFREKEDEYKRMGASELYEQLFQAKFRSLDNRVIPDDLLLQAQSRNSHYPSSKNLIMGVDFGRARDYTAVVILDIETGDIKFVDAFQDEWQIQFHKIRKLYKDWSPIQIIVDKSSIGDVIISDLQDLPIYGVSIHNDILKKQLIDKLILAFYNNKVNIVADEFPRLINELSNFVYLDPEHKKVGPVGRGHDDTVIALALCLKGMDVSSHRDTPIPDNLWSFTRIKDMPSNLWEISTF